jgi:transcriptional regulator with XRE-family HTH domain
MQLRDWMDRAGMTHEQLAMLLGVPRQTTYSWARGQISAEAVARVQALTNGFVTALDFFPTAEQFGLTPDALAAQNRARRNRRRTPSV